MVKQSNEVMWALTKRWNSKMVKFQGKHWSRSEFSHNGLHNASQVSGNQCGVSARKDTTEKNFRRIFTLATRNGRDHNGKKLNRANSQAGAAGSVCDIRSDVNKAAKAINSLCYVDQREKTMALRKLAALSRANRSGFAKSD